MCRQRFDIGGRGTTWMTNEQRSLVPDRIPDLVVAADDGGLSMFGSQEEGEGPGQFIAPHGIAVDSKGDVYVAEVSYTIRGRHLDPPREMRSLSKYARVT